MQSEPTLPRGPQRTHPATAILGFGSVGFAVLLAFLTPGGSIVFELFLALIGLREIARWYVRTYDLRADALVVREGIITHREQIVPYSRVQQVDIHRGVLAQVLGLSELRIDTAGSAAGHVTLRLLEQRTAESIRAFVLSQRAAVPVAAPQPVPAGVPWTPPGTAPPTDARPVLVVPIERLVLAGATANVCVVVGCALVVCALAVVPIAIVSPSIPSSAVAGGIAIAFALFVAVVALSVFGTVLQYASLTVSETGDDVRVDYGALDKQHLTVPRRRVQHVTIADNPLRRALGIVDVTLHSAAAPGAEHASHLTVIAFPRADVGPFLASLMHDPGWHLPPLQPRTRAAHRRAIVRRILVLAVPAFVAAVAWFPTGLFAFVIALAAGTAWGEVAHRRAGHAVTSSVVVFGAGAIAHHIHVVPTRRVQSARTTASPLQRRAGLATVLLDVAGSASPRLYDIDAATAQHLLTTVPRSR